MIDSFRGEYGFLSNFTRCRIVYEGLIYRSVEHAYQAAKVETNIERAQFTEPGISPGDSKRMGRELIIRDNWDQVKLTIMEDLLRIKFNYPVFKDKLLNTYPHELEESNSWGDTYWGVCNGTGENHLGKLLMQLREDFSNAPKA